MRRRFPWWRASLSASTTTTLDDQEAATRKKTIGLTAARKTAQVLPEGNLMRQRNRVLRRKVHVTVQQAVATAAPPSPNAVAADAAERFPNLRLGDGGRNHELRFYQMSPIVNPSGKGSDGSTEYWAIPVIQAVPLIVGTTAGTPPTVVFRIRRPTNSVPTGPK